MASGASVYPSRLQPGGLVCGCKRLGDCGGLSDLFSLAIEQRRSKQTRVEDLRLRNGFDRGRPDFRPSRSRRLGAQRGVDDQVLTIIWLKQVRRNVSYQIDFPFSAIV